MLTCVFCFCLCLVCFESRRQPLRLVEALDSLVLTCSAFSLEVLRKTWCFTEEVHDLRDFGSR